MTPGLWGGLCALSWGTSDFIARFSGRALGHSAVLFGMLLTGSVLLSLWVWLSGAPLQWADQGLWPIGASGVSIMVATLWLYQGLVRGPVSIVAPIVGSYPALIVVFAVVSGTEPSPVEWTAMAATLVGIVLVARSADRFATAGTGSRRQLRGTVSIALASSAAFAVGVFAAQTAVPSYGELQTTWLSRLVSLAALAILLTLRGQRPSIAPRWWPAVGCQGALDSGGYVLLYAGSHGAGGAIAAVAASAFGAVTTLLAWIFLREAIRPVQWLGIALIFVGVGVLSA